MNYGKISPYRSQTNYVLLFIIYNYENLSAQSFILFPPFFSVYTQWAKLTTD